MPWKYWLKTMVMPIVRMSRLRKSGPASTPVTQELTLTPKPKARLHAAQSSRPRAMMTRELKRSTMKPLAKREAP